MDNRIDELIYGASQLAYTFEGGTRQYWSFPKNHINQNETLLSFLNDNANIKAKDIVVQQNDFSLNEMELENENVLFLERDRDYLAHDSLRYIIYNYCLYLLESYLAIFKNNVINEGLRELIPDSNKYFYSYNAMSDVEKRLFSSIAMRKSVMSVIKGNFHIRRSVGNGIIIDINGLDELINNMHSSFNFTNITFD